MFDSHSITSGSAWRLRLRAAASCLFLCASLTAINTGPAAGSWTVIGPGGGGATFLPSISPHDPLRIVLRCDMTGGYVTSDGGSSWRMFNLRGLPKFFRFDPKRRDTIYTSTLGLLRSDDGARTWNLVYPAPDTVSRIVPLGDHAGESLVTTSGFSPVVEDLAVDPLDGARLYGLFEHWGTKTLRRSDDGGKTWVVEADLPGAAKRIILDPTSPPSKRRLMITSYRTVTVREGEEMRSTDLPSDLDAIAGFSFGVAGGEPILYLLGSTPPDEKRPRKQILRFDPRTGAMRNLTDALVKTMPGSYQTLDVPAVATAERHANTLYVSFSHRPRPGRYVFGVARTDDGGATFSTVLIEPSDALAPNMTYLWLEERMGQGWGENPQDIGVDPNDPEHVVTTDLGRVIHTRDGGKTWKPLYSKRLGDGSFASTGLDVTTSYGVHFDPFDTRRIFLSMTDVGLFRSENGGQSFVPSTTGFPRYWVNTTYWVEFDSEVKGRMWAAASRNHDLPRPKMWRRMDTSEYKGGVMTSTDGGRRWTRSDKGMPETAVTHILLDPRSPKGSRTLYAAGFGKGVFKSSDGGASWSLRNKGIEGSSPLAWRLTMDPSGQTLYLVVARRSEDDSYQTADDGALYVSSNGAGKWTRLSLPNDVNGPSGLAVDPKDPKRLLLAAWSRRVRHDPVGGGIYLSQDAGKTWKAVLTKDAHVYDVTFDSRNPDVVYAAGFNSSAWRSGDRGNTWNRIRGFNFKWGHRVLEDPRDASKIFVTTFGGGVWHGPAVGDPKASENIITPSVAPQAIDAAGAR